MLLFYVRHGDPCYKPDSLTPLGERQAEAVAKRLALFGVDKVYSSTSTRAAQTARPTCELLSLPCTELDAFNESYAVKEAMLRGVKPSTPRTRFWPWEHPEVGELLLSREVRALGDCWYEHPALSYIRACYERLDRETQAFLSSLGYEYDEKRGAYRVTESSYERVALFAHEGVGKFFLSSVLHIPFPMFSKQFELCHTGVTAIEFKESEGGGIATPHVLSLSNDSHLYRDLIPRRTAEYAKF